MNKIYIKFFVILVSGLAILLPTFVSAQTTANTTKQAVNEDSSGWGCEGLQEQINQYGGGRASELPKYCSETEVYKKVVYWLYYILGLAAVISLIYGGFVYLTARSNEAQAKKGKNILIYTLAGVALAIIATTIVTIVVNLVVDNQLF